MTKFIKTTDEKVTFINLGSNNYSNGMELVSCYPMPKNMVDDVLAGKYQNIWLNPSAPCKEGEFFGVKGSKEQYKDFYEAQKEAQISKEILRRIPINSPLEIWEKVRKEVITNYKDWWD